MASETIFALIQAVLKLAPEIISIIEGLVGHGNTIAPEQLPQLISKAIEISKNQSSASIENSSSSAENNTSSNESSKSAA